MVTTEPFEQMQVVGKGRTQLLFETTFKIKPPMSKLITEAYDVEITDYTVLTDRVQIKGTVEKTFYYQHPHLGKKGKNSQKNESNNKEEQSQKKEAGSRNDSATSEYDATVQFLSKFEKKSKKHNKEDNSQKKEAENKNDSVTPDDLKCITGSGKVVNSYNGIVHFFHQVFDFSGNVEIPGVMPGDYCQIELAEARDYGTFVPVEDDNTTSDNTKSDNTMNDSTISDNTKSEEKNGLIKEGRQMFQIEVVLTAVRSEKNISLMKTESESL